MAEDKKSPTSAPPISDVEEPGKSAASATSKPVLVTNRPIIKDPMVVDEDQKDSDAQELPAKKTSTKPKIQPLETSPKPGEGNEDQKEAPKSDLEAEKPEGKPAKKKPVEESEEVLAQRQAEREANLQKIVDAKTYYLPINAVEKRKTKRFVVLGLLFSILLIMVWVNIALDAELVQINGISPLTSFF